MTQSLAELIKRFAEDARAALLLEAANLNSGNNVVKFKKINEFGKAQIEVEGIERSVEPVGSSYLKKDEKVFYDKTGSIEYKKVQKAPAAPLEVSRIKQASEDLVIPRSTIIPAFLAISELGEPRFYNITSGFHLTASGAVSNYYDTVYVVLSSGYTIGGKTGESSFGIDGSDYYGTAADGGKVLEIFRLYASATTYAPNSAYNNITATTTYDNEIALATTSPGIDSNSNYEKGTNVIATPAAAGSGLMSYELDLAPSSATMAAEIYRIYTPITKYYYKFTDDDGIQRIRIIDLKQFIPGTEYIKAHQLIHNFGNPESDGNVYVYSIFYVMVVGDDSQSITGPSGTTTYHFPITYYIIHTRLNLNDGSIQYVRTESTKTFQYNAVTSQIKEYDNDDLYLAQSTEGSNLYFPQYFDYLDEREAFNMFEPGPIWQNAFPGDWLYAFRNIPYDANFAANVTPAELWNFLQCSYQNNTWAVGMQGAFPETWDASGFSATNYYWYRPTSGEDYYGGLPLYGDYRDMEGLSATIQLNGYAALYPYHFNGVSIAIYSVTSNVATVTTSYGQLWSPGMNVLITNSRDSVLNGQHVITDTPGHNQFSFVLNAPDTNGNVSTTGDAIVTNIPNDYDLDEWVFYGETGLKGPHGIPLELQQHGHDIPFYSFIPPSPP